VQNDEHCGEGAHGGPNHREPRGNGDGNALAKREGPWPALPKGIQSITPESLEFRHMNHLTPLAQV
jgi:hypothetical protein